MADVTDRISDADAAEQLAINDRVAGFDHLAEAAQCTFLEQMSRVGRAREQLLDLERAALTRGLIGRVVEGTALDGAVVSGVATGVALSLGRPMIVGDDFELPWDRVTIRS